MPFFHVTRGVMSEGTSALFKTCVIGGSAIACAYAGYQAWQYFSSDKSVVSSNSKDEWFPTPDTISIESDVDSGYLVLDPRFTTPKGVSWLDICPKEPHKLEVDLEADYIIVDDEVEEESNAEETEYYDDEEEDEEFYDPERFADAEEDEE